MNEEQNMDYLSINKKLWNDKTPIHYTSDFYDVEFTYKLCYSGFNFVTFALFTKKIWRNWYNDGASLHNHQCSAANDGPWSCPGVKFHAS